jgi:hypothetical protein
MDGRSFASLLRGGEGGGRDWVIKEYNENAGGFRNPMRAIESLEDLYIFSPWANGMRTMATATMGTPTYRRMAALAKTDPAVAARHDLFVHRVPEEFYAVGRDPDCVTNLAADASAGNRLDRSRKTLETWMDESGDPMLGTFRQRGDAAAREAFMSGQVAAADERKADKPRKGAKRAAAAAKAKTAKPRAAGKSAAAAETIAFELPGEVEAGKTVTVKIRHDLPADMGEQVLTVTAKEGQGGARLDRKTVRAKGTGVAEVALNVPPGVDTTVSFAAFIGEDYKKTSRHITSKPVPVVQK